MSSPTNRIRLLINKSDVGPIIGSKGNVIKTIQEETQTTVRIDGETDDPILNTIITERVLTITSPVAAHIADAAEKIAPILLQSKIERARPYAKTQVDPDVYRLHCLIHSGAIAELIGTEGKNITDIRNQTGASITVRSAYILPFSSERTLIISGDLAQVRAAVERLVPYLTNTEGVDRKAYRAYIPSVRLNPDEQRVKTTLGVKNTQVGVIIGAKGRNIAKIRRYTSCTVDVKAEGEEDSGIVSVIVSGPESNVNAATKLIRASLKNAQMRAVEQQHQQKA